LTLRVRPPLGGVAVPWAHCAERDKRRWCRARPFLPPASVILRSVWTSSSRFRYSSPAVDPDPARQGAEHMPKTPTEKNQPFSPTRASTDVHAVQERAYLAVTGHRGRQSQHRMMNDCARQWWMPWPPISRASRGACSSVAVARVVAVLLFRTCWRSGRHFAAV
jgi:hypothetical protein